MGHYCERISPDLLAEPFNTFSNIFFFIAGILALRRLLGAARLNLSSQWDVLVLALLLFLIGVGSSLWHIVATQWAWLADIVPILLFINLFLLSCLLRVVKLKPWQALTVFVAYNSLNALINLSEFKGAFNGSLFYIPSGVLLFLISLFLYRRRNRYRGTYLRASLYFLVALSLRTIDLKACAAIPVGTHFLWHAIIALTLYQLYLTVAAQQPYRYNPR